MPCGQTLEAALSPAAAPAHAAAASRTRRFKAVLFDVDGTLYHQPPLRALMAAELAWLPAAGRSLRKAREIWRILAVYRTIREELREADATGDTLAARQYAETAQRTGQDPEVVVRVVDEWMGRRPLKYLPLCRRAGLGTCLAALAGEGIRIGALSDYPVDDKLTALGVRHYFDLALCTTDADINALKPHPAGFLQACAHWSLAPDDVLYVGDRADVDATGAAAAGMRCLILGRQTSGSTYRTARSLRRFQHALDHDAFL